MKKILLLLIAGFCFGSLAMAQDPAKAANEKKKATKTSQADYAARVKAKEARAKEIESGSSKANPAASSKKSLKAETAN